MSRYDTWKSKEKLKILYRIHPKNCKTFILKPSNKSGFLEMAVVNTHIWGCERADACSHPQICGPTTVNPYELKTPI